MKKLSLKKVKELVGSFIEPYETEEALYRSKKLVNITGDACAGDIVWFAQDVFGGNYRKPKFIGTKLVRAIILKDSYGSKKQQHTFTLALMKSPTSKTYVKGSEFRIKGRNLYKHFTFCENFDRKDRNEQLNEKHRRGEEARTTRAIRRTEENHLEDY